jgi:hypothetical protein
MRFRNFQKTIAVIQFRNRQQAAVHAAFHLLTDVCFLPVTALLSCRIFRHSPVGIAVPPAPSLQICCQQKKQWRYGNNIHTTIVFMYSVEVLITIISTFLQPF